jgi:hypothetical protein
LQAAGAFIGYCGLLLLLCIKLDDVHCACNPIVWMSGSDVSGLSSVALSNATN